MAHDNTPVGLICAAGVLALWIVPAHAGLPECHYEINQCSYTVNPRLSDLIQSKFHGDYTLISRNLGNQEVFCDIDNWKRRSEMCGPCAYHFEFTSGVPAAFLNKRHCIGGMEKNPYIEASNMDIRHPLNGKEMRVVTHAVGGGCSPGDYPVQDLSDTIAVYNYMDSYGCGGGLSGGARVQAKMGAPVSVLAVTFFWSGYDNERGGSWPPRKALRM